MTVDNPGESVSYYGLARRSASSGSTFLTANILPPEDILCSINKHVMKEPVQLPGGNLVERESAMYWFTQGQPCPFTGDELTEIQLVSFIRINAFLHFEPILLLCCFSFVFSPFDCNSGPVDSP